jgi:CheY-like chemotaxis protein
VIDDNVGITAMLKEGLERTGLYEVREQNNGHDGLETARQFRPDLVLLDLMMPQMSGGDVARWMKAEPSLEATRIIFLTALVSETDSPKHDLRCGGHRCLSKSISLKRMVACVAEELASTSASAKSSPPRP